MLNSVRSFVGWGVSLTRPVLESVLGAWRVGSLLHAPVVRRVGISLSHPVVEFVLLFVGRGVSLTRHVLESVRRVRSLFIIRPELESVWPLVG